MKKLLFNSKMTIIASVTNMGKDEVKIVFTDFFEKKISSWNILKSKETLKQETEPGYVIFVVPMSSDVDNMKFEDLPNYKNVNSNTSKMVDPNGHANRFAIFSDANSDYQSNIGFYLNVFMRLAYDCIEGKNSWDTLDFDQQGIEACKQMAGIDS